MIINLINSTGLHLTDSTSFLRPLAIYFSTSAKRVSMMECPKPRPFYDNPLDYFSARTPSKSLRLRYDLEYNLN